MLYSEGFNPRPKLSLPLPRSVGIEVDDDLFCLRTETSIDEQESDLCTLVKTRLSEQLPDGFELLTVRKAELDCLGCNLRKCPIGHPCMLELSVDAVMDGVGHLLAKNGLTP